MLRLVGDKDWYAILNHYFDEDDIGAYVVYSEKVFLLVDWSDKHYAWLNSLKHYGIIHHDKIKI